MGTNAVINNPFTVGYTVIRTEYDNIQSSSHVKKCFWKYSSCKNSMAGITLVYNAKTNNTATSIVQLNNLDQLTNIKKSGDDWDGYGSAPISIEVIERARRFVKNVFKQPELFPTSRNSIQMQYELSDRSYLEFELYEDKIVCMIVPHREYSKAEFKVFNDVDDKQINKVIKEFYGL